MSKRPAEASSSSQRIDGQPFPKAHSNANKREAGADNEMGEFEDAWEDEVESDEEIVDAGAQDEDGALRSYRITAKA